MLIRHAFFKTFVFILILSTILFISYGPPQPFSTLGANPTSSVSLLHFYGDLDQQLCQKTIDWRRKSSLGSTTKQKCPEKEKFVSIVVGGRTGNLMWAYASALAVAQQTGLKAYIPSCLKKSLEDYFEDLTVPSFKDIFHCPVKIDNFVKSIDEWIINPQKSIILPRYIVFPRDIIPWIPNIWREFTLKKTLRDSAQHILNTIVTKHSGKNYTFVGVHVRRTDYKGYLKRKYHESLAKPQFFLNAMAYFRQKYPDPLFIFVSDDPQWCIQQFGKLENVFVITDSHKQKKGAALDLAVMVACNHTIYDYGTFGTWGAILAGGEAVFYDMIQNSKEGSMKYNNSWHLMS